MRGTGRDRLGFQAAAARALGEPAKRPAANPKIGNIK